MCKKDDEALRLLREVVTGDDGNPSGANQHSEEDDGSVDNINRSSGTSKDYTLDRLAREDPAQWHDFLRDGTASIPYKSGFCTNRIDNNVLSVLIMNVRSHVIFARARADHGLREGRPYTSGDFPTRTG
ncbi:hypothetical protein GGP68_003765 [Salinibacter ruber]|uniref:Uncharacterized protein n=1 Tax=Salinibacter ruber TaxID=146919 RepID=A0A9X2QGK3_9BACT|nr:hypothetical protein [Salinibacter ruber]MCS3712098.1 hypothetical protein [Salinibacter ruber]